jgi:glycosyltransferase involved in cell wall biosynthesis
VKVVQFHRKPFPGQYSIEGLFNTVRAHMHSCGLMVERQELPFFSRGVLPRMRNMYWARRRQGDINHITGDVHFLALGLDPARTILTIHDLEILNYCRGIRRELLKIFWYNWPLKHAAVVTVISETTKRSLVAQCDIEEHRVVVIPNAVSQTYRPHFKPFDATRPRILHIGTKPHKNLTRLIAAVAGTNCHLHVIGPLTENDRRDLDRHRVEYTNDVGFSESQLYQAYCEADLVSLVSTAEGFGLPIVEAQWVERPVLTSNCSSMPEVAGMGACLVDPFDVESIRRGFRQICDDESYRNDIIRAGRENRQRFSIDSVTSAYTAVYQKVFSMTN